MTPGYGEKWWMDCDAYGSSSRFGYRDSLQCEKVSRCSFCLFKIVLLAPPKWKILSDVLEEIKEMKINDVEIGPEGVFLLLVLLTSGFLFSFLR